MQYDVADIGFCTVFATLRCSIRETHLHVSSLVPCSTGRRGCRHTKDAAMANPAARAIFLPENECRGFLHIPAKRFNPDSGDDGASFAMLGQWPLSGRWLSD